MLNIYVNPVSLVDQIKMANVIITLKVMPKTPEVSLSDLKDKIKKKIEEFDGIVGKIEEEPIGFGLVSLIFTFSLDEKRSNLDPLEDSVRAIDGVSSAEVVSVTRSFG